jgi:hypothetical protein
MLRGQVGELGYGTSPTWMSASSLQGRIYGVSRTQLPHLTGATKVYEQIFSLVPFALAIKVGCHLSVFMD